MRKLFAAILFLLAMLAGAACLTYVQPEPADAQAQKDEPVAPPPVGPSPAETMLGAPKPADKPAGEEESEEKKMPACKSFFDNSLHATGEGMRYWYEEEGGFMQVTGIPYKDLNCKSCHADSCDKCHKDEKDGIPFFSTEKTKKKETCLACHKRTAAAINFDKKAGIQDVHFARGMVCADCHKGIDVHGDGKKYKSMREPDAVKVSCVSGDCHKNLNKTIKPHKVHRSPIDCTACHVSSTITCVNCHFDNFLKVKKRVAGSNFFPAKSWTLLVNHEGKVTTGNAQTLVGKGKKFVAYVPYFTHSIVKEGKKCNDCHNNEAAARMLEGNPVEMATFAGGKLTSYTGVVPFVPDLLKWPWLDHDAEDKWTELKSDEKPIIQNAAYAEPLTEKQLKKLKLKMKE